jgi:hypothetical protein
MGQRRQLLGRRVRGVELDNPPHRHRTLHPRRLCGDRHRACVVHATDVAGEGDALPARDHADPHGSHMVDDLGQHLRCDLHRVHAEGRCVERQRLCVVRGFGLGEVVDQLHRAERDHQHQRPLPRLDPATPALLPDAVTVQQRRVRHLDDGEERVEQLASRDGAHLVEQVPDAADRARRQEVADQPVDGPAPTRTALRSLRRREAEWQVQLSHEVPLLQAPDPRGDRRHPD